ncbi:MAG: Hsp20/alpha crystallin family protein [Clostridiales bacterium]|jgi:HSP20 family protein|nr:Hsp20/alpha crystallin family protein [Eubacteriales bacterium]MDH7567806.1 Hsp20/alpha crystallin family protein [Clostridiales bacterium]
MSALLPWNRRNYGIPRRNSIWDLRSVFEDFFNDSFFPAAFAGMGSIRADIRETDKEFIVDAELPGVRKEDIRLDLRDDVLTISVEHKEETSQESEKYIWKERKYGALSRSFFVDGVKQEAVTAKFVNGVLTVILPKQEGSRENRHRIEIQ